MTTPCIWAGCNLLGTHEISIKGGGSVIYACAFHAGPIVTDLRHYLGDSCTIVCHDTRGDG